MNIRDTLNQMMLVNFSERLLMSNVKRRGIVDIVGEIKASEKTYTQFRLTTT